MHQKSLHRCQEGVYIPRRLLLQWHITERCNLRCSHCYQESYSGKELGLEDLLELMAQFKDLLKFWRHAENCQRIGGHITVTGGEPFVRQDFLALLEVFSANSKHFSFAILTNGSSIDSAMARELRKLGPRFVQVSIEGAQATHDKIRGEGNFEQTVSALKHLVRERIRTFISFTAHRGNFHEFAEVARLGRRLRVSSVWADRLIPWGTGSAMKELVLTPDETQEFFEIMKRARKKATLFRNGRTEVAMHRALQFLVGGGQPYHCTAGDTLITIQPNGDLYPCRRMPIRVGNLMETNLFELYYNSELFRALRNRDLIGDGCRNCFYSALCRGGLKCLSYALTGDPFQTDPGCWLTATEDQVANLRVSMG